MGMVQLTREFPSGARQCCRQRLLRRYQRERTPGAKAHIDFAPVMPGLKSRPISDAGFSALRRWLFGSQTQAFSLKSMWHKWNQCVLHCGWRRF
jgi:hypothetical protein